MRTSGKCPKALLSVLALTFAANVALAAESGESALDSLKARAPAVAERLDPVSRAILARVTAEQLEGLQEGELASSEIRLANGTTLAQFVDAVFGGGGLAIPFSTIDAGGGTSTAGTLTLMGTIGQHDAALAENNLDGFLLVGGFRGRGAFAPDVLFRDDFETGGTTRWSDVNP
jgi:hypothetical protein